MNNLSQELIKRITYLDIEIAEDLSRRLPNCNTLKDLSNFFRMLLAQYRTDTILYRSTINDKVDSETWFTNFFKYIFPFIETNGLPNYTDTKSIPMYHSTSQSNS